jgi:hypothetical protein
VHEEVEDVDEGGGDEEGEGAKEGEQQEEEEGDSEGEQTSRGYVVTSAIDEGEGNLEVMRQYQRELEADERALEEDSSDDDDDQSGDHVLWDWQNYDFSQCTINSGENVPWEYTENEVCEGAMYPSTAHLKDAVKQWSTLTLHREFRVVKSSPRIHDVCCKKDYSFRVYAYMGKWDNYLQVKEVKGHTCTLDRIDASTETFHLILLQATCILL